MLELAGTGDDGTTGLLGGGRAAKDDPRIEAFGTIDEASSLLRHRYELRGLVIKEGPQGATLYRHEQEIHLPALPVDPPIDPTGAASLRTVAAQLTAEGVPTPSGRGEWTAKAVSRLRDRLQA